MDNLNCLICKNRLVKPIRYISTYDCLNCGAWFNSNNDDVNNLFIKGLKLDEVSFLCYDEDINEIKIVREHINKTKYLNIKTPQNLIELNNHLEIYNFFKRIKDNMEFL